MNLPEAITLSTNSTSEAVNMVKGSAFRAAIGSKSLIEIEGLKELAFPIFLQCLIDLFFSYNQSCANKLHI